MGTLENSSRNIEGPKVTQAKFDGKHTNITEEIARARAERTKQVAHNLQIDPESRNNQRRRETDHKSLIHHLKTQSDAGKIYHAEQANYASQTGLRIYHAEQANYAFDRKVDAKILEQENRQRLIEQLERQMWANQTTKRNR